MERMSKEQIEKMGKEILGESDLIAMHGTSLANGLSILDTGLNFHRTSMVIQENDDIVSLCTYGWKENPGGDAVNVIISVPKSFFKDLLGYDDISYSKWIKNIKDSNYQSAVINSVCDMKMNGPVFNSNMPKEFIKGMFVYTDNKTYLSFASNPEEGMNHLTYIDNSNFYEHLNEEQKKEFVSKMRKKMFENDSKTK